MSNSTHNLKLKGVDATGGAFASVGAKAKATGASIRAALGGALAAAGAYLSLRSVAGAVNQLGQLSDLAMKAGMSVEFLTKATTAFQVAGLNVSAESLVKAMQYMQKNTGKQGEGAFFDIAKQIAAIPDAAQRAQAAVQVFGRSGLELLPLVNNGEQAIEKFQKLQSIMPGVSTAAANAGDAANDALTIFGKGAQAIMLKAVGKICALWGDEFPGGVRAGALNAISAIEWFAKMTKAYIAKAAGILGANAGLLFDGFMPALKTVGASLQKIFSGLVDTLKLVATSLFSIGALAYDAVTKGPAAAWDVFKGTMSAATEEWKKSITDTSKFDEPIAQMKQAWDVYKGTVSAAENDFTSTVAAANKEREEYLAKLKSKDVGKLFDALQNPTGAAIAGEAFGAAAAKRISNALILGGSNQANKLAILGPQYQNEAKKQTSLLEKIAKNTEKTAENTEEGGDNLAATDL